VPQSLPSPQAEAPPAEPTPSPGTAQQPWTPTLIRGPAPTPSKSQVGTKPVVEVRGSLSLFVTDLQDFSQDSSVRSALKEALSKASGVQRHAIHIDRISPVRRLFIGRAQTLDGFSSGGRRMQQTVSVEFTIFTSSNSEANLAASSLSGIAPSDMKAQIDSALSAQGSVHSIQVAAVSASSRASSPPGAGASRNVDEESSAVVILGAVLVGILCCICVCIGASMCLFRRNVKVQDSTGSQAVVCAWQPRKGVTDTQATGMDRRTQVDSKHDFSPPLSASRQLGQLQPSALRQTGRGQPPPTPSTRQSSAKHMEASARQGSSKHPPDNQGPRSAAKSDVQTRRSRQTHPALPREARTAAAATSEDGDKQRPVQTVSGNRRPQPPMRSRGGSDLKGGAMQQTRGTGTSQQRANSQRQCVTRSQEATSSQKVRARSAGPAYGHSSTVSSRSTEMGQSGTARSSGTALATRQQPI